jgi:hypothetical protein
MALARGNLRPLAIGTRRSPRAVRATEEISRVPFEFKSRGYFFRPENPDFAEATARELLARNKNFAHLLEGPVTQLMN